MKVVVLSSGSKGNVTYLEINNKNLEVIRLVRNTEDISWQGQTWTRFPFSIETSEEDGKTIPSLNIQISNCEGIIQAFIQKEFENWNATTPFTRIGQQYTQSLVQHLHVQSEPREFGSY